MLILLILAYVIVIIIDNITNFHIIDLFFYFSIAGAIIMTINLFVFLPTKERKKKNPPRVEEPKPEDYGLKLISRTDYLDTNSKEDKK